MRYSLNLKLLRSRKRPQVKRAKKVNLQLKSLLPKKERRRLPLSR
jgi:hypothetical protein